MTDQEPRGPGGGPVLSDEHIDFILQLVAEGDNPKEITAALKDKYGVSVTEDTVYYHSSRKEERVIEKRRALEHQLDRIAASSKFVRLRRLGKQAGRLENYDKGDLDIKSKERLLLDNEEQARKEVDGFKGGAGLDTGDPFAVVGVVSILDLNKAIKQAEKAAKETEKQEQGSPE